MDNTQSDLKKDDYQYISVPGNGACLFNSVAQYVHLDDSIIPNDEGEKYTYKLSNKDLKSKASQLRKDCVDWLEENMDFEIPIIKRTIREEIEDNESSSDSDDSDSDSDDDKSPKKKKSSSQTIKQYLNNMRKVGSYGGQNEIIALSHVLKRNIGVYKSNGNGYIDAILGFNLDNKLHNSDIYLYHNVNEAEWENIGLHHYDLLYPINRALIKDKSEYDKLKNKSKQPIKKISKSKSSSKSKSIQKSKSKSNDSSSGIKSASSGPVTRSSSSLSKQTSDDSSSKDIELIQEDSTSDKSKPKSKSKSKHKSKSKSKSDTYYKSKPIIPVPNSSTSESESKPKSIPKTKPKTATKSKSEPSYIPPVKPLKKSSFNISSSGKKNHTKRCEDFKQKSPPPGCANVEGCIWIPKIGCLPNDPERIKKELAKKNIKKLPDKTPKKSNNCKTFKKNKKPKCKEQSDCKWVEKQGKKPGYCDNN